MLHTFDGKEFRREYNILNSMFEPSVIKILKELDVVVAGGALTSLFTNREINDLDLYFRDYNSFEIFCAYMADTQLRKEEHDLTPNTDGFNEVKRAYRFFKELDEPGSFPSAAIPKPEEDDSEDTESYDWSDFDPEDDGYPNHKPGWIRNVGMTDKSVMFSDGTHPVMQCIAFDVFADTQAIFDKYDFTINMGAFRFKTDQWEFHREFLKHNAQKVLVLNPGTDYPIISMLRASKYQTRGFTISRRETMKLGLAASRLDLKTWDDAKAQLSGMYGTNVEELFSDKKPFSFERLFDKLDTAGDNFINRVATEKEKGDASNFALESKTYFQQLQRIRRNSGRPYFDKLYGVMRASQFYVMTPHESTHKYGIGYEVKDPRDTSQEKFFGDVQLFVTLEDAEKFFDKKAEDGWNVWGGTMYHMRPSVVKCGSVIVEISLKDTDEIMINQHMDISVANKKRAGLKIVDFIKSDGDIT